MTARVNGRLSISAHCSHGTADLERLLINSSEWDCPGELHPPQRIQTRRRNTTALRTVRIAAELTRSDASLEICCDRARGFSRVDNHEFEKQRSLNARVFAGVILRVSRPRRHTGPQFAAGELVKYLHRLFPACEFHVTEETAPRGSFIRLGTLENSPQIARYVAKSDLTRPDSFVVAIAQEGQSPVGIIAGMVIA